MKGIVKFFIYTGLVLPLALYVLDVYVLPTKYYKETPLGIT